MSYAQQQVSSPRRLALHHVFPRKPCWLSHVLGHSWSNISFRGIVSFSMHTSSPLHFTYQALNCSVPCTSPVYQQGICRKPSAVSLFLSLSFSLPPSLQVSLNPISKLAEATMLKSSREEPAHSTALLYICRFLWFQGKSKGVFAFLFF